MKDTISNRRKYLYLCCSFVGIILTVISLSMTIYDFISYENSIYITSKVVSLDVNTNDVTVKYTVNNKEYESQIPNDKDYAVNDKTMIRVSIKNPLKHVKKHQYIAIPSIVIALILLVATLKKSIKYLKRDKNIRFLKLNGMYVQASITDVFVNNNGQKYKKLFPYKLRAKYANPGDNNLYIFDSEDTYVNLNEVLDKYRAQGIIVYIDKTNFNNYYVDLNSLIPHVDLIDPIEFMKSKPVEDSSVTTENNENLKNKDNEQEEKNKDAQVSKEKKQENDLPQTKEESSK